MSDDLLARLDTVGHRVHSPPEAVTNAVREKVGKMSSRSERFLLLSGVLFVVFIVASFAIEGSTPNVDSARDVADFYNDNEVQVTVASLLGALAAAFLVVFAASVRRALQREGTDDSNLPAVAFGGGIVAAAGIATDSALRFALAQSADDIPAESVQTLYALWENFFWPMSVGIALLILAVSLSSFSTRVVPLWLAWVGIVISIALLTPAGFIALPLVAIWILIATVLLWRRESSEASDVESVAPAGS